MFIPRLLLKKLNETKRLVARNNRSNIYNYNCLFRTLTFTATRSYVKFPNKSSAFNNGCTLKKWFSLMHQKHFSKKLIENDVLGDIIAGIGEGPIKSSLNFPQPRVTLNELNTKTPDKIFDIHYKQAAVAPKGGKKKKTVANPDWTCMYSFVWPEKIKFEGTGKSKQQAAEKAASQAIHWLYTNRHIDDKGSPKYNQSVLKELQSTLNKPAFATISNESMEKIEQIWKKIYDATYKEAKQRLQTPQTIQHLLKDSSIDEEGYSEDGMEATSDVDEEIDQKPNIHPVFGKNVRTLTSTMLLRRERALQEKFRLYEDNIIPLPIDDHMDAITSAIDQSRVVVVVGAAGCGKSTRVPAGILKNCGTNTAAIVSEPRRVAAIGLAQRVADELGEDVGDSIGYTVRLQSKPPRPLGGAVLYCTSGVLLKRLQINPGLDGCTHVLIDEAHERDVNTDVTLLLLKRAMDLNPQLKVIVMSATLDTEVFTRYFNDCPIIEVPGRTFPVDILHLEDIQRKFSLNLPMTLENSTKSDVRPQLSCPEIVEVIKSVDKMEKDGAILVFLPGWAEIKQVKLLLDQHYGDSRLHMVLPVHSRLSTTEQTRMFARPSLGIRKIVLATNIAETSITIPDVVYVVDAGAHKENRIKEGTGTSSLETVWVSQAGAKQRAGRAGRVQPGVCYRMYTKDKEAEFAPHTTPEILRIPLEQTALDCKSYAPEDKVEDFLSLLPNPPSKQAIRLAVHDLIDLGAFTSEERLTRLGSLLSLMSTHPRLGCCLLHACTVGCLVAIANITVHCSDNVELFHNAADRREEIRETKRQFSRSSDHAALHWIQEEYEQRRAENWRDAEKWCDGYGMRKDRLDYVRSLSNLHLEAILKSGVIEKTLESEELNRLSDIEELVSGVLLSGSNSILTSRRYIKRTGKLMPAIDLCTSKGDRAHIGSESVNHNITKRLQPAFLTHFGGHHSADRRALVAYSTSLISPHTVILFSKGDVITDSMIDSNEDTTEIYLPRHKLKIQMASRQAGLILKARTMLWNTLEYYIERDLRSIEYEELTETSRFKTSLVKIIGRILVEAQKEISDKCVQNVDVR